MRFLIKYKVDRHEKLKGHELALQKEKALEILERTVKDIGAGPSQPLIDTVITEGVAMPIKNY